MYREAIMFTIVDQREVVIIGIRIEKKLMFRVLCAIQIKNKTV